MFTSRTFTLATSLRFGSHVMLKRPGQLIVNRIKDAIHFYIFGIGIIPLSFVVIYYHIFYGKLTLSP